MQSVIVRTKWSQTPQFIQKHFVNLKKRVFNTNTLFQHIYGFGKGSVEKRNLNLNLSKTN